jgi:transaldolase
MTLTRSPIARLLEYGQSPWYDNLTRGLITGGGLTRLIEDDGIRGVTSNPTIFEKAMSSGEGYDEQLAELGRGGTAIDSIYWALVLDDIRHAADILRPTYDTLDGRDGFVSVEVAPDRAHETAATVEQVHWLHDQAARPNVFVKIPATLAGVPAIEECLAEGISR